MTMLLSRRVGYSRIPSQLTYLFPSVASQAVSARRVDTLKEFVSQCDVVTVNCPLHENTKGLVNAKLLDHFKPVRSFLI